MPAGIGAKIVEALAFFPYRYKSSRDEESILNSGQHFLYGKGLHAWRWGHSGPLVILIHGWGGSAVQWRNFIVRLVDNGYQVIAPDISGHGRSAGRRIGFDLFAMNLDALIKTLETAPYAIIGHSAGGLAMMAARFLYGVNVLKFICIAAPSHPYPPIKVVKKKLKISEKVTEIFMSTIAAQFQLSWEEICPRAFQESKNSDLLLIYDRKDRYLNPDDVSRIKTVWPTASTLLTENVGHEKLIRCEQSINEALFFLKSERQRKT